MALRGLRVSAPAMAMDSTPAKEKTALVMTDQYPRNLPQLPEAMCSTKGPGLLQ